MAGGTLGERGCRRRGSLLPWLGLSRPLRRTDLHSQARFEPPQRYPGIAECPLPCPSLPTSCLSDATILWALSCQSQNVPPSFPSTVSRGTDQPRENKLHSSSVFACGPGGSALLI